VSLIPCSSFPKKFAFQILRNILLHIFVNNVFIHDYKKCSTMLRMVVKHFLLIVKVLSTEVINVNLISQTQIKMPYFWNVFN